MKLYWKVSEVPVGRYRSFATRGWPSASFDKEGKYPAAWIVCKDEYRPSKVKTGVHSELTLRVTDYSVEDQTFKWRTVRARFPTLESAKRGASEFFDIFKKFLPTELQDNKAGEEVNGRRIRKNIGPKNLIPGSKKTNP
jgi:hypothetical protein